MDAPPFAPNPAAAPWAAAAGGYDAQTLPHPAIAPPSIASMLSRVVAILIDGLVFFGVFYLVGCLVANGTDDTTTYGFSLEGGPAALVGGIAFLAFLLYYTLFEGVAGATLGKLVMGIRVERRGGGPAGIAAALVRTILRVIDGIGGYLVGFIAAMTSPLRQRIGDRAAGTVVTRWPRPGGMRLIALLAALALAIGGTAIGALARDPAEGAVSVNATLARGVTSDNRPVDPTNRFAPTQERFFLAFSYDHATAGSTKVRSVWYAVDVGNAAPANTVIDETTLTLPAASGNASFALRRSSAQWPVGTYKVELYVDTDLVVTQQFSVAR